MLTPERIKEAGEFVEWLRQSLHGQELPQSNRVRAAGACFAIAQGHHHAIVLLIENRLYSSSFALIRLEFEAYIRGLWFSHCAKDSQIDRYISGKKCNFLETNRLIGDIEEKFADLEQTLSMIKSKSWSAMCEYTHTGGLHVQRFNTNAGIEPNYSDEEIEEVLKFSENIGAMSVIGVAELGDLKEIESRVIDRLVETGKRSTEGRRP